ncbi:MAG TPA: hypothetical protein VJH37_00035 [Candidatus Nanoarchaeia archaeon]|nr:hypothetical protein [Candidatus Nanoarchaeia archaeon]
MRKGQIEHFTDIVFGVLISLLAYALLTHANATSEAVPFETFGICDAFGRETLLFLQTSPPEQPELTYADWVSKLFTSFSETERQRFISSFSNYLSPLRVSGADPSRLVLRYPFLRHPIAFDIRFSSQGTSFSLSDSSSFSASNCKPFFIPHLPEPIQLDFSWKPTILPYGQGAAL